MIYDIGDVTRVHFRFRDIDGDPVDPSAITVTVKDIAGATLATYTTAGGTVVNNPGEVGAFYCDHEFTVAGTHRFKATATGTVKAAVPIDLVCRA